MSGDRVAGGVYSAEQQRELSDQWRALRRLATGVAILTSPAVFIWLHKPQAWPVGGALLLTSVGSGAFRGLPVLIFHRFIRWPRLFWAGSRQLREEDVGASR